MALGLLGAALAGGAGAAQENAMSRIQQMREEGMQRMRQEFASKERAAGQQFSREERVAGQQFTSGENEANRGHDLTLTQMREQGANSRSGAQIAAGDRRAGMGLLTQGMDTEGNPVWFNPMSGEQYNAPPGVTLPAADLSSREEALLDVYQNEYKALSKRAEMGTDALSQEEQKRLQELPTLMQQTASRSGLDDIDEDIEVALGGGEGSDAPPLGNNTISSQASQESREQRSLRVREENRVTDAADNLISRIEREKSGGAWSGGLLAQANQAAGRGGVSQESVAEAQELAQKIQALNQNPNVSADRKRWLSERLDRLRQAGIPIELD